MTTIILILVNCIINLIYPEFSMGMEYGKMIRIPDGEFIMGSKSGQKDEMPEHLVYLDEYWIGTYEITNKEYKEFVNATNYIEPMGWEDEEYSYDEYPVIGVSWYDAVKYLNWKGKEKKINFRLPTEAEWEKAARGNDKRIYPWGNGLPDFNNIYRANYRATNYWSKRGLDGYEDTSPVFGFLLGVSPFGVFNLSGNTWEWCSDWYDKNYYSKSPYKSPQGPDKGRFKILRGGSWINAAHEITVFNRIHEPPDDIVINYGFRAASTAVPINYPY